MAAKGFRFFQITAFEGGIGSGILSITAKIQVLNSQRVTKQTLNLRSN